MVKGHRVFAILYTYMIKSFRLLLTFTAIAIASATLFALTPVASSQSSESFILTHGTITSNSIAISWNPTYCRHTPLLHYYSS